MSQLDTMAAIYCGALNTASEVYDRKDFVIREATMSITSMRHLCAVAWADMHYTASVKDFLRTQQACCAVYAVRCALEVVAWIEKPTLSGEQRIYNLLAMTRAKAAEARMLNA